MATLGGACLATFARNKRRFFYARITIPKSLRAYVGRREVWRSLGTRDRTEASYRALQFELKAKRLFLTLHKKAHVMTRYEIEALVNRWQTEALDEAEDDRALGGPYTDAALEAKPEHLIGGRAYDCDGLDAELKQDGVNMIAPHRSTRKLKTQDGRHLRRYERR